jgi:hypothetical protein
MDGFDYGISSAWQGQMKAANKSTLRAALPLSFDFLFQIVSKFTISIAATRLRQQRTNREREITK